LAANSQETATANVELAGDGWRLRAEITVPTAPTRLRQLLPMVQTLTNNVVDRAVQASKEQGKPVSCKKGCASCCRQLVPISEVEAGRLAQLVEDLPEPRGSQVRNGFRAARQRLAEAGLLDKLQTGGRWTKEEADQTGLDYFGIGIPCPFLEEESCSIYADRPLACREYLVTSPAENCQRLSRETVRCLKLPFKVSTALHHCERGGAPTDPISWVPLILTLDWAKSSAREAPALPGPRWVEKLLGSITGKEIA
jgi:Fe-S-cluster containining protein